MLELLAQGHYQRAHEEAEDDIEDIDDDQAHVLSLSGDHDDADEGADTPDADDEIDAEADVEQVADAADGPAQAEEAEQGEDADQDDDSGLADDDAASDAGDDDGSDQRA